VIAWAIGLGVTAGAHRGWLAIRDWLVRTRGWSLATLRPPLGRTCLLSSAAGGWLLGFLFDRVSNVESLGGLGQSLGFWAGLAFGASALRFLPSLPSRFGGADDEARDLLPNER
jgi:hypothetical protein